MKEDLIMVDTHLSRSASLNTIPAFFPPSYIHGKEEKEKERKGLRNRGYLQCNIITIAKTLCKEPRGYSNCFYV